MINSIKAYLTLFLKFLTFLQNKKTFQKQLKHLKVFLWLINKDWACENTFKQVQSHEWIWHSLNIDICVVCGYKKWDSPSSNVKLQWSIQSRYTQLALDNVTHLNYRNIHIWPLTYIWVQFFEAFHLAPHSTYHLIFLKQYISLWDQCLKFFIFQFNELAFGFYTLFWLLSIFPSQILVCAIGFYSLLFLFIWRFTFGKLF